MYSLEKIMNIQSDQTDNLFCGIMTSTPSLYICSLSVFFLYHQRTEMEQTQLISKRGAGRG